jgi:hypothetical protein
VPGPVGVPNRVSAPTGRRNEMPHETDASALIWLVWMVWIYWGIRNWL